MERLDVIGRRKKSPSEGPTKNTRPGLFKDPVCDTEEDAYVAYWYDIRTKIKLFDGRFQSIWGKRRVRASGNQCSSQKYTARKYTYLEHFKPKTKAQNKRGILTSIDNLRHLQGWDKKWHPSLFIEPVRGPRKEPPQVIHGLFLCQQPLPLTSWLSRFFSRQLCIIFCSKQTKA